MSKKTCSKWNAAPLTKVFRRLDEVAQHNTDLYRYEPIYTNAIDASYGFE
jgi:hypothetical protein